MTQQGSRLYRDGNMWCATGPGFIDLAVSNAGFGETHEAAVADLAQRTHSKLDADNFVVGGYCRQCREWVPEGEERDGCRDPECPCN